MYTTRNLRNISAARRGGPLKLEWRTMRNGKRSIRRRFHRQRLRTQKESASIYFIQLDEIYIAAYCPAKSFTNVFHAYSSARYSPINFPLFNIS